MKRLAEDMDMTRGERIRFAKYGVRTAEELFWTKVDKSGECWTWTGQRSPLGYGRVSIQDRSHQAHRVSWEMANGSIPDGLLVCHHCDNPPCIRPDHLFLGTDADNLADMRAKGRRTYAHKTHCPRGHALTDDNMYIYKGRRNGCKTCGRERVRARRLAAVS